jgi:hypothetical protein
MVKYTLIIEYLSKGNNFSQVATLCGCSRTTVWQVLQRIDFLNISLDEINEMQEEELRFLLFPERIKKGNGYLISDFKWEEFQMRKHQSSLRLCWRRYCKRALKQNLKAYSWASFVFFYGQFRKPCSDEDDPKDKVRNKLKRYNLMLSYCNPNGEQYQKLKKEKEEWLKSLHLDESKIVDKTYELYRNNTDLISSCYFLYCPGVTPNLFLNTVLNCDKFENPTA